MNENMNYDPMNNGYYNEAPADMEQPYQRNFDPITGEPIVQPMQQPVGKGFAIAGMVCGIVAIVLACCSPIISIICAIAGIVLSILAVKKKQIKGMAIAGIITSGVAVFLSIIILIVSTLFASTIKDILISEGYGELFGIAGDYYGYYDYEDYYDDYYDELEDMFGDYY